MFLSSSCITAQELKSLFEKKSLKEKPPNSGKQSILSVRLEQCPLQLNNPFNEYSKFDGKGHVGTTATKKIDVYLPLHSSQDRLLPMTVVTMASARVQDLIGLICWQYTSEGREPKLNDNVSAYCLHIAEDDGEVDTDFPPLDSNEPIHKFGFSTLALVEKYSSPGLTSKESLFVRMWVLMLLLISVSYLCLLGFWIWFWFSYQMNDIWYLESQHEMMTSREMGTTCALYSNPLHLE